MTGTEKSPSMPRKASKDSLKVTVILFYSLWLYLCVDD